MRMSARSNPPTSPQYALPPPPGPKCLDINTHSTESLSDIPEDSVTPANTKKRLIANRVEKRREGYPRVASAPSQT